MFKSSFLNTASPELARFNGMSVRIYLYDDHTPPHIHVRSGGNTFRLGIPSLIPLEGKVPSTITHSLSEWFGMQIQQKQRNGIFTSVSVGDLVWEQWWNARNKAPVQRIPVPNEIKATKQAETKTSSFHERSLIEYVELLRPFVLMVKFADGSQKEVDIKKMRGDIPPFGRILGSPEEFAKFRFEPETLLWGEGTDELEIESEDLYAVGW